MYYCIDKKCKFDIYVYIYLMQKYARYFLRKRKCEMIVNTQLRGYDNQYYLGNEGKDNDKQRDRERIRDSSQVC